MDTVEFVMVLEEWLMTMPTPRRIICRKQIGRRMHSMDDAALRGAKELLDEGRISIVAKRDKKDPSMIVYYAERVA